MDISNFTLWPSLVSGVLGWVLGMAWYGPLFGAPWRHSAGITPEMMARAKGIEIAAPMALSVVAWLGLGLGYGVLVAATGAVGMVELFWLAAFSWLTLSALPYAMNLAFQGRPFRLWLIDAGYLGSGFLIFVLVHALWV